jgi:hypothetical protein
VVRDPPRKSEQASRAVRCSWDRRAQPRRPSKCGPCIERRQRNGRGQRHRLWIPSTQRERFRRILGNAAPCPGGLERSRYPIRARQQSMLDQSSQPHSRLRITNHRRSSRWYVLSEEWPLGIERKALECMKGHESRCLEDLKSYSYGNIVSTFRAICWVGSCLLRLTRYILNRVAMPFLELGPQIIYFLCSRIDPTLAFIICNTM